MSNSSFEHLLKEKVDNFKLSFLESSRAIFLDESGKLIHPGEFGQYRESVCKDFIRFFVPRFLDIGQGFLINSYEKTSHQCDIVIYDSNSTPLIESNEKQRFYPVETVVAVGEVKSILTKAGFAEAINKLSKIKMIREEIAHPCVIKKASKGEYNPIHNPYDQIFTFLICQKLNFDVSNITNEINSLYSTSILSRHKHNLILSLEDGLLAYYDKNDKTMMYPQIATADLKNRFVQPNTNVYCHFKFFLSYLFMGTSNGTILYPEISDYMGDITGGNRFNEE